MQHFFMIVEGAQDIAVLGKCLKSLDFVEIKNINRLSDVMKKIIPRKFPFEGNKLNIFNFIPFFFEKDDKQVAIINANGETRLLEKIEQTLSSLIIDEIKQISKILIFADGDLKNREEKIKSILNIDFEVKEFEFLTREALSEENPYIKIEGEFKIDLKFFIFPDNNCEGRLENIILEAINCFDGDLLSSVEGFTKEVDQKYKMSWGKFNSKEEKAKIGIVGNILSPGAGTTAVLYDDNNNWVSLENRENIKSLKVLYSFLEEELMVLEL